MKSFLLFFVLAALYNLSSAEKGIHFVSLNTENLFDTQHDPGKNDYAFLPATHPEKKEACKKIKSSYYRKKCLNLDWNEKKLQTKIGQLKRLITHINSQLPDILLLVEVENEAAVARLAKELGYSKFKVTNSPDKRGVDLAILYKASANLKLLSFKEHRLAGRDINKPTRNVLEATFRIRRQKLVIFGNHWPSQSNPARARAYAAKVVQKRVRALNRQRNTSVIVSGDFNVIEGDFPHPFKSVLLKKTRLKDAHKLYLKKLDWQTRQQVPPGTYFYAPQMAWNRLDRIFLSKNLLSKKGLTADISSYKIHTPPFAVHSHQYSKGFLNGSVVKNVPWAYEHNESSADKVGFSDHFAVSIWLR